jgi:hypothetical protein
VNPREGPHDELDGPEKLDPEGVVGRDRLDQRIDEA